MNGGAGMPGRFVSRGSRSADYRVRVFARMTHRLDFQPRSRQHAPGVRAILRALACALLLAPLPALALKPSDRFNLSDLENDTTLDPGRFANLFEEFAFEYNPYVQPPESFLRNRSGDCDDYAILADYILTRRLFKTRLIKVELVGTRISHVVCYVQDKKVYLDYNNRIYFRNLERSGARIRQIAEKVAETFGNNWTSATEYIFSYAEGRSRAVRTVLKTDPPERDPDA